MVPTFYYTGVGAVLLGSSVKFIYNTIQRHNKDKELLDDIRDVHLPNIYAALDQIAKGLGVELALKAPGPKPLVTEAKWIRSGWLQRKT
jgi:hypothetical protein